MKIDLPADVAKGLPDPSSDDGLIRCTVGIRRGADGSFDLVEVNDSPVPEEREDSPQGEDDQMDTSEAMGKVYDL